MGHKFFPERNNTGIEYGPDFVVPGGAIGGITIGVGDEASEIVKKKFSLPKWAALALQRPLGGALPRISEVCANPANDWRIPADNNNRATIRAQFIGGWIGGIAVKSIWMYFDFQGDPFIPTSYELQ
jgi:hypothetical protein